MVMHMRRTTISKPEMHKPKVPLRLVRLQSPAGHDVTPAAAPPGAVLSHGMRRVFVLSLFSSSPGERCNSKQHRNECLLRHRCLAEVE